MQHYTSLDSLNSINFHTRSTRLELKTKKSRSVKRKSTPSENLKVLVVEDELINQYVAKSLLESKGYQVDIAATGQAALHCYQANQYAVILMDMGLPDLPGTEVTRHIRTLEQANGQHIPIIALTANGLGAKPECLAAGMDDFSGKPFEIDQLDQVLKVWIEKSK